VSVESRAAVFKRAPSGSSGIANAVDVRLDHIVGNSPGTAVNH
jgi:hypothetical protein